MSSVASGISNTVSLGAGCYWGTEKFIKKDFQKLVPGSIAKASVGFMSPDQDHPKNPSYREVCSGSTGHVEVLNVELNDPEKDFRELIKFFFLFHDPTTMNKQGNDAGTQYASAIFVNDDDQKRTVTEVINELQIAIDNIPKNPYAGKKISTAVHDATMFYEAHKEHQEYLSKNPNGYCNHYMRMKNWPGN